LSIHKTFLPEDGAVSAETCWGKGDNTYIIACVHFGGLLKTSFMKKCTDWKSSRFMRFSPSMLSNWQKSARRNFCVDMLQLVQKLGYECDMLSL
jgi:hypothetical protein